MSLASNSHAEALSPTLEARLAAIRSLGITDGKITLVRHDTVPSIDLGDNRSFENVPPRTIVKAVLHPATGSTINIEICLPEPAAWNGRLLGQGSGGAAGYINSNHLIRPMIEGYATATTDLGTAPDADSGIGNPEVWKDFGYRATHLMTTVAKQVVAAHYGRSVDHAYFVGGSTGGQQALQLAQRHPEDYDGIVATIPAHCRTPLHAYFLWNDQILHQCPITPEQDAAIIKAGNDYMAARETPPVAGRFVSDPRRDTADIEAVIALALKTDPTLTSAHAAALRKLFDGPRHAVTGERIFNGIPFGSSILAAHDHLYLFKWVFGADRDTNDINFGPDIDTYTAALGPYLNAENPDLSAFRKRGGKLIITTGSVDSVVPSQATIDYYERVIDRVGGLDETQSFCRLFIIPGMAHGWGPGISKLPDLLKTVVNWREQETPPAVLVGQTGDGQLKMPLYPYPTKTGWDETTSTFRPVTGPRGGVEPVAQRFLPPAAE